jgi:hypothetical protein
MSSCNYNCADLPAHEQVSCGNYRKGGINAVAIVDCGHTITDWENATQWQTNIDAGLVTLIQPVRGAIPDPSPVEGPNPNGCGSENTLDDFDRTATWIDFNVTAANITFYNALNKRIANLVVYHGCDTPEITVIENNVNFVAMRRVDENKRVKQSFAVTAKWTSLDEPSLYDAPAGIFTV